MLLLLRCLVLLQLLVLLGLYMLLRLRLVTLLLLGILGTMSKLVLGMRQHGTEDTATLAWRNMQADHLYFQIQRNVRGSLRPVAAVAWAALSWNALS